MNEQLHHKWNDGRDPNRGSNRQGREIPLEEKQLNRVSLKQNKPR